MRTVVLDFVFLWVLAVTVLWLGAGFTVLEWDVLAWSNDGRGVLLVISTAVAALGTTALGAVRCSR